MPEHPSRDDNATTSTATPDIRSCPICDRLFQRIRRQRYCSDTCRRTAWRRRHAATQPELAATPAARSRRDTTVYQCGECEQRYCSDTCRRTAWRRRHTPAQPEPPAIPAARPRRDNTVYQCGECEQRYLGEQWCPDSVRPCRRIGASGLCSHCDEPVAIPDLLEAAEHPASQEVGTMPDR